jgi:hypothetical protein
MINLIGTCRQNVSRISSQSVGGQWGEYRLAGDGEQRKAKFVEQRLDLALVAGILLEFFEQDLDFR